MSKSNLPEPAEVSMSQESELNARAAAEETFEQKMAFETYYKLGQSRSLVKLAKEIQSHRATLERWSSKFRWSARVKEREKAAAEYLMLQQDAKKESEIKKKQLQLVDGTIAIWSKKLADGNIKINSIDDLEKLINLRWKIAGIPDKQVNPQYAQTTGGATVDLRLRNMDKGQLQQFLYSTLKSIERVMTRTGGNPQLASAKIEGNEGSDGSKNLSIEMTVNESGSPEAEENIIDLDDPSLLEVDFDDSEISID